MIFIDPNINYDEREILLETEILKRVNLLDSDEIADYLGFPIYEPKESSAV
jgi:hypothetical protein